MSYVIAFAVYFVAVAVPVCVLAWSTRGKERR